MKELIVWIAIVWALTAYLENKSTNDGNLADNILANNASTIPTDPEQPEYVRNDVRLVTGIIGMKSRFLMGIKKERILRNIYYNPSTGFSGIND